MVCETLQHKLDHAINRHQVVELPVGCGLGFRTDLLGLGASVRVRYDLRTLAVSGGGGRDGRCDRF